MREVLFNSDLVILENRQRREFEPGALVDLGNSIGAIGLLHPIVIRETPGGPVLVAGERRLRAIRDLWALGETVHHNGRVYPPGEIPFVTLGDLPPLEAEEAELDENLKRQDLTWQEHSEAIGRLHRLRTAQADLIGESHSISQTLEEANSPKGSYSQDRQSILLSQHLENPVIAKAKNVQEAFKALKREESREKSIALAELVGKNYNSAAHKLVHTDCLDWLESCPENSYDVILTDPPYGMNADSFGNGANLLANTTHEYKDTLSHWRELLTSFSLEAYRVAKAQSHAYIFCDFDRFHELKSIMEAAGWYVFRTPLIVYKHLSGRVPLPEHGPRRQYELILYAIKGGRPTTGIFSDVIQCKLEENLSHGAGKPIELYVNLLRRSVRPGDTVLDAFAGTGTIFPAAHECKLYATGLELNKEYYGISVNRLNALDDEPTMV